MTDSWHYEKNGQRIGAISATEIGALIQNRTIDGKTLVWSQGLADWTPLAETDLAVHLRQASAPPVLPATRISNTIVWILAFAPIIGAFLEATFAAAIAPDYLASTAATAALRSNQYWYITLLVNIGLSLLDDRQLKRAGVDTSSFGKFAFIVPVYLWRRAASLRQPKAYFWVWIATFVLIGLI
ncbi:hypothetical protein PEP31012_00149 [Pandoraea eparura]|uniref:GYF domain-containing protein n=1 Tax=Pandoraea eparura TaxID=2508291 RepID=A0A5E4RJ85_9BURK|nr:DUF4339 domain-containing protein [Pandoraea eparura]VVD61988.1 hypothetical protein PEP31012_00149 [Pandoraea eparura]